jgi:predicted Zn-dependent peptidase
VPGTAHAVEHLCFMGTKRVSNHHQDHWKSNSVLTRVILTFLRLVPRRDRI